VVDPSQVVALLGVAVVLIVAPGPGVLFIVGRGVRHGRRAAVLTALGHDAGLLLQALLVAAGIGQVVQRSIAVFTVVKLVGAAYLVWLGAQALLGRGDHGTEDVGAAPPRHLLRQAFVVGSTNPKGFLLFASVLPQFVDAGAGAVPAQLAVLGSVCVAVALVTDCAWAVAAGSAQRWFRRSPRRLRQVGAAGGVATIGLGVRLALARPGD
jgi:threonine/homoserine/homoserine lactone efflux protein